MLIQNIVECPNQDCNFRFNIDNGQPEASTSNLFNLVSPVNIHATYSLQELEKIICRNCSHSFSSSITGKPLNEPLDKVLPYPPPISSNFKSYKGNLINILRIMNFR